MLIFQYKITSPTPIGEDDRNIFRIDVTDNKQDNATTWFYDKEYRHTLPRKEIERIKNIIKEHPDLFEIPEYLEPSDMDGGSDYSFTFCDGARSNSFKGDNILDYGRRPHRDATLALRVAREIKEKVLEPNHIRTMISSRLQHWPRYRKESDLIPPCRCPRLKN